MSSAPISYSEASWTGLLNFRTLEVCGFEVVWSMESSWHIYVTGWEGRAVIVRPWTTCLRDDGGDGGRRGGGGGLEYELPKRG